MSTFLNFPVLIIFLTLASLQLVTVIALTDDRYSTFDQDQNYTFFITGGYRPAKHTLTKYLVSIRSRFPRQYFGDNHRCGGSIISPHVILTAAHCIQVGGRNLKAYSIRVVAKTSNRLDENVHTEVMDVKHVRPHPDYNAKDHTNDIGILILKEDIEEDDELAQRIALTSSAPAGGTKCTVIGWGRIFYAGPMAADAMYVDINIIPFDECGRNYKILQAGMLCASDDDDKAKDSCSGDSGGPLICNDKVTGVVSFGYMCATGSPGFYADVWHYRHWINENNVPGLFATFRVIFATLFVQYLLNKYIFLRF